MAETQPTCPFDLRIPSSADIYANLRDHGQNQQDAIADPFSKEKQEYFSYFLNLREEKEEVDDGVDLALSSEREQILVLPAISFLDFLSFSCVDEIDDSAGQPIVQKSFIFKEKPLDDAKENGVESDHSSFITPFMSMSSSLEAFAPQDHFLSEHDVALDDHFNKEIVLNDSQEYEAHREDFSLNDDRLLKPLTPILDQLKVTEQKPYGITSLSLRKEHSPRHTLSQNLLNHLPHIELINDMHALSDAYPFSIGSEIPPLQEKEPDFMHQKKPKTVLGTPSNQGTHFAHQQSYKDVMHAIDDSTYSSDHFFGTLSPFTTVQMAAVNQEFFDQIMMTFRNRLVREFNLKNTSLTIDVHHQSLGKVTIELDVANGYAKARFKSQTHVLSTLIGQHKKDIATILNSFDLMCETDDIHIHHIK